MSAIVNKRMDKGIAGNMSLLLLMLASTVHADEYHYVNTPVGNRAADLGGAYTALSDDPTGLFYNPAGVVYAAGSNLSASMNTLQTGSTTYKNVIGGQSNWVRSSSTLLPNFFGVVQPLGKGVFGFSYAVPDAINEDQDQVIANVATTIGTAQELIINYNNTDNTYNIGPSYAYQINDHLAVGGTLYYHYRHKQRINNILLLYPSDRLWTNEYYEVEEYGIKPVLGVMWSPVAQWSLGATLTKVSIIGSDSNFHISCLGDNASPATAACQPGGVVIHQVVTDNTERAYPLKLALGATWFPSSRLLVSADVTYYDGVDAGVNSRDSVINVAVGSEYYLSSRWALRGGFFTDLASTPDLQPNVTSYNQAEHVDLVGVSLGIAHFNRNSSLSLGVTYSVGSGKSQIFSGSPALQDAEMENLGVSLAASYTY
ncbi:MAG: long-chain fatty acid transport protein [Gammaproteobacteria bacterium]|nr:MAG: long-chain fatty acid transport protein [Gammaproteobacteria bacterium]TND04437.1 MAG: long-chain fatty acid transport protein [Gammaproteobacteria bacterium]